MIEPVKTEHLFTLEGDIDPPRPVLNRLLFNVIRGSIEGSGVKGEIAKPSGDWVTVRPNGTWVLDVRLTVDLDDGHAAFFYYNGIVCMTEELQERITNGDTLTGDEIYFRSAPYIETSSEKYAWLNDIVCVGKLRTFGGGSVVYDIFKVL